MDKELLPKKIPDVKSQASLPAPVPTLPTSTADQTTSISAPPTTRLDRFFKVIEHHKAIAIITFLMAILAVIGTAIAGTSLYLQHEQVRPKHKDIEITHYPNHSLLSGHEVSFPELAVTYKGKPTGKIKLHHYHIVNVGEVSIDDKDFELGPIIKYVNSYVIDAKITNSIPSELRASVKAQPDQVSVHLDGEFRVKEDIALDVLFADDPGLLFEYIYRIKGGDSRIKP